MNTNPTEADFHQSQDIFDIIKGVATGRLNDRLARIDENPDNLIVVHEEKDLIATGESSEGISNIILNIPFDKSSAPYHRIHNIRISGVCTSVSTMISGRNVIHNIRESYETIAEIWEMTGKSPDDFLSVFFAGSFQRYVVKVSSENATETTVIYDVEYLDHDTDDIYRPISLLRTCDNFTQMKFIVDHVIVPINEIPRTVALTLNNFTIYLDLGRFFYHNGYLVIDLNGLNCTRVDTIRLWVGASSGSDFVEITDPVMTICTNVMRSNSYSSELAFLT